MRGEFGDTIPIRKRRELGHVPEFPDWVMSPNSQEGEALRCRLR